MSLASVHGTIFESSWRHGYEFAAGWASRFDLQEHVTFGDDQAFSGE